MRTHDEGVEPAVGGEVKSDRRRLAAIMTGAIERLADGADVRGAARDGLGDGGVERPGGSLRDLAGPRIAIRVSCSRTRPAPRSCPGPRRGAALPPASSPKVAVSGLWLWLGLRRGGLVQLGLLEPGHLPVVGAEAARSVVDRKLPLNGLITRAHAAR